MSLALLMTINIVFLINTVVLNCKLNCKKKLAEKKRKQKQEQAKIKKMVVDQAI